MWENVVSFVLPTDLLRLLPELGELLSQGAGGAQVEDVLPGQGVIEEWVTHMGEQPEGEKEVLDGHTKACLFYIFFQQNQPALSSLPFLLPLWKKSALRVRRRAALSLLQPITAPK